MEADISFDRNLPHSNGLFVFDGISAIKSLKAESTGLDELENDEVFIYPNPAKDFINISIENSDAQDMRVDLLDMQGKNILTFSVGSGINNISTANLDKGIYLVKISNPDYVSVERLVIE